MKYASLIIGLLFSVSASATDSSADAASAQTQALLKDPAQRAQAGKESPKAAATMKSAESFVGKDNTDALYNTSSDIFARLVRENNGDPMKAIEEAQKNPEAFYNKLTPAEKSQIEDMAKKIDPAKAQTHLDPLD